MRNHVLLHHVSGRNSAIETIAILSQIGFNGNTIVADDPHGKGGRGTTNIRKNGSSELSVENEIERRSKITFKADGICLCSNWLGIDINGQNPNLGITVLIGDFYRDAVEAFKHFF